MCKITLFDSIIHLTYENMHNTESQRFGLKVEGCTMWLVMNNLSCTMFSNIDNMAENPAMLWVS